MKYYEVLKNYRNDLDIKQYELAKEFNISPKTYSMYETGARYMPLEKLDLIIYKFNLSLDYVLGINTVKSYDNMKNINLNVFFKNIRKIRKELKYNQGQLAKLIGCNQQTLSEYERGTYIMPIETLYRFCLVTNSSADYVTGRIKNKNILKEKNADE